MEKSWISSEKSMSSDGLDKRMRVFETAHDHSILPSLYTVVRLDGRNFSKLTSDLQVDKPMDEGFRDHMLSTCLLYTSPSPRDS